MKMHRYVGVNTEEVVPEASSMIESFRSVGYSVETAVSDIIDNSISAGAKNIEIYSEWRGGDSYIFIKDDGKGMNASQLIEAMRPGSKNPLQERSKDDLGRFGLGLKTASFSQCRCVSVISKAVGYKPVYYTWDLDYVGQTGRWTLLNYCPEEFMSMLDESVSGTVIIWTCMDRIVPMETSFDDIVSHNKFLELMGKVRKHLSITFHRFIEDRTFVLHGWGVPIEPWDPFLTTEDSTQSFADQGLGDGAVVKGFVLPHRDKISDETYKFAEGAKGWNEQQGFYVYRNKRLLLAGDWLGLGHPRFRKEEHSKLARIRIDIPNTVDSDWHIDIKKSSARPPQRCSDMLESYAKTVRSRAVEVYRHRGKITRPLPGVEFKPIWLEKKKGEKWSFVVNREHSIVTETKSMAKSNPDKAIETLLKFIENTIPTKSVFIKESEQGENQSPLFEGLDNKLIANMIESIVDTSRKEGKPEVYIKSKILNLEPFNKCPELVESILSKNGK